MSQTSTATAARPAASMIPAGTASAPGQAAAAVEQPEVGVEAPKDCLAPPEDSPVSRDKISRLARGFSAIPVVGGFGEIWYGLRERKLGLDDRQKKDGNIDIIRGATAQTGSLANLPVYAAKFGLVHLATGAGILGLTILGLPVLGLIGGVANTVNAIMDGGRDVKHALHDKKDPNITPEALKMANRDLRWGCVKLGVGLTVAVGSFMLNPTILIAANVAFAGAYAFQYRENIGKLIKDLPQLPGKVAALAHKLTHRTKNEAEAEAPAGPDASTPALASNIAEITAHPPRDPEAPAPAAELATSTGGQS